MARFEAPSMLLAFLFNCPNSLWQIHSPYLTTNILSRIPALFHALWVRCSTNLSSLNSATSVQHVLWLIRKHVAHTSLLLVYFVAESERTRYRSTFFFAKRSTCYEPYRTLFDGLDLNAARGIHSYTPRARFTFLTSFFHKRVFLRQSRWRYWSFNDLLPASVHRQNHSHIRLFQFKTSVTFICACYCLFLLQLKCFVIFHLSLPSLLHFPSK